MLLFVRSCFSCEFMLYGSINNHNIFVFQIQLIYRGWRRGKNEKDKKKKQVGRQGKV